jgi:UDP-N-acetylmuramoyl-L-alanyl-D-glutamate--2,6-diaminopimelate ligase
MQNIRINSKLVEKGDVFIGFGCSRVAEHVEEARRRGASLVFLELESIGTIPMNSDIVIVDDARMFASNLYRIAYPNQPECCVAITGTNGKSSVAHFVRQLWSFCGKKSANLGTLGLFIDDSVVEHIPGLQLPKLTTPDSFSFHKILNWLKSENVDHFVFEASSHALHQKRLHSVSLSAAAFTNFESDHLDYHKSRAEYLDSKLKLFSEILGPHSHVVISRDNLEIYTKVSKINDNLITFGMSQENNISVSKVRYHSGNTIFDLIIYENIFKDIQTKLFGDFQLMNLMCAVGITFGTGLFPDDIEQCIHKICPLRGRMEFIIAHNGIRAFVDYAHTSSAFHAAMLEFRKICEGKLICVFGCGGDRDKSKRIEMGRCAEKLAEVVIITDDNPRSENPSQIRSEILQGCRNAIEIGDRKEAIRYAVNVASSGDCIVVIGKGHEVTQNYGSQNLEHDDKKEIIDAFELI